MQLFMNSQLLRQSSGMSKIQFGKLNARIFQIGTTTALRTPAHTCISLSNPPSTRKLPINPLAPVTNTFFKQQVFFCANSSLFILRMLFHRFHMNTHMSILSKLFFQSMFNTSCRLVRFMQRNVPIHAYMNLYSIIVSDAPRA